MFRRVRRTAAFTLIELLVVVSIIALLASILLPSLSRAREQARAVSCMSNMRNVGLGLAIYLNENRNIYPTAYDYVDGSTSAGGYYHWTAALDYKDYETPLDARRYPRHANQYVCPSHAPQGWAPSNFTSWRVPTPPGGQVSQDSTDTLDDRQAPRLSYVTNEIFMPRKKFSAAHDRLAIAEGRAHSANLTFVNADRVESPTSEILAAEFSNSANCIWGDSLAGGVAYKSHRPTNGIKSNQTHNVFNGERYEPGTQIFKLTYQEARAAIDAVLADKSVASVNHHISYIEPDAHITGSNYLFVDGHVERHTLQETLDPGNYMWGRRVYSVVDRPVVQDNIIP